jgi:hypothetical protein
MHFNIIIPFNFFIFNSKNETVVIYAMELEPTALNAICKIKYFRILKMWNIFVRESKINLN